MHTSSSEESFIDERSISKSRGVVCISDCISEHHNITADNDHNITTAQDQQPPNMDRQNVQYRGNAFAMLQKSEALPPIGKILLSLNLGACAVHCKQIRGHSIGHIKPDK